MSLIKISFLIITLFSSFNIYSCDPFTGSSLFDVEDSHQFKILENQKLTLTLEETKQIPLFNNKNFNYKDCKNALRKWKVQDQTTLEIFNIIFTNQDDCDGGNTYGNILNNQTNKWTSKIEDGEISCL